ncbi:protein UPSTREAM OF FLC isoform X2 [Brassica rapa]|uniref:protein UPSTREAM OF FLC isoform X2 n=1 Tax=Brassica campestris TaxID=3711 RepID=UPI0004F152EA|nr:protein UPSTREAM OF FLC isoform X2 [Brassica rapa]XP_022554146.1 protein SOSEKI 2-like isoform X2 [Brassica napus]XP_048602768.1 protein SOSEKI 2-like isoform X2 [Brassica napus]XP_048626268.1 protein SOSEKI 2-like isoform X2 [Brassica napus]
MEAARRRGRESNKSPERLIRSLNLQQDDEEEEAKTKRPIFRRVQVVYYLTRNGHLEHPHFIEVITPVNQHLRLRDVMNRLTVLRGKNMPSLYAWSCKRSYRNGFVWNDLAENDVIYPSNCENVEETHVKRTLSGPNQEAPKSRLLRLKPKLQNRTTSFDDSELYVGEDEEEEDGEYGLSEEKTSYTSSTTPQSRCSRGIYTETIEFTEKKSNLVKTEESLPVRSDSSELTRSAERVEDGDPVCPGSVRGSIWLQMISCGHIAKHYAPSLMNSRPKEESLRKGVMCKNVVKKAVVEDEREMIRFMSENPRFGNPQAEEKEYFSGSIVESVSHERVTAQPTLRRSNSFNEERSKVVDMAKEVKDQEEKEERSNVKVRCIPRRKSSSCLMSSSKQTKN